MKTKTNSFWLLLFLQCLSISAVAQWAGGSGNGRSPSAEVKTSSINAGGVSADVNLFTGTLNTAHTLGTVTTPSGLSFTAGLSHNSTFAAGDNLPHSSGIPYGEGWSLGLPMISMNTEDFAKYSIAQKSTIRSNNVPDPTEIYMERTVNGGQVVFNCTESEEEGVLYYFSPELSIPGYASGRLVYKEKDEDDYVFVLNVFERYVEARLRNGNWTVIMDDGTVFKMSKRILTHRNPSNQRIQSACHETDILANLHLPKTEYLSWYCEVIKHPLKKGDIRFEYDTLGCFNFFDVYDLYGRDIMSYFFGQNVTSQKLPKACKDIFINRIYSQTSELVFNYDEIAVAGEDLPGPGDEPFDNLYRKIEAEKYIFDDFEDRNWHRYHHIKSKNVNLGCTQKLNFTNPLNPYVGGNSSFLGNQYVRQNVENQFYGVPFDHGYLESDRIGSNLPAGDIYEVETTIRNNNGGLCLFDINIATGDARFSENAVSSGNNGNQFLSEGCYEARTGESIYNTFNRALKWPSTYNNYEQVTHDLFVMPNHPPQYQGFHIQIGPSNSDNQFSKTPVEVNQENSLNPPDPCTSYFERLYPNPSNPATENIQNALTSGASIPQKFGVGLPWYALMDFYDVELGLNPCPTPTTPAVGFWWNHTVDDISNCVNATPCDQNGFNWNNEPTCAVFCNNESHPSGIYLYEVKLYRYAKRPYMLTSVEYNEKNTSGDFVLKQELSFTYDNKLVERYAPAFAKDGSGGGQELNFLKNGKRNIFILTSIVQEPVNGTTMGPKPTTSFEYYMEEVVTIVDDCAEENTLFHNTNFVLLDKIIDPLGKETDFDYHPFSDIFKIVPTTVEVDGTDSYSLASYLYKPRPGEQDAILPGTPDCWGELICGSPLPLQPGKPYAYQTYAVVSKKKVKSHSGVEKVWTYEYQGLKPRKDQISFADNFQYDKKLSRSAGYETAIVKGPSFNGVGFAPTMKVKHFQDNLLWGKVNKVVNSDIYNNIVSATVSTYETLMVHDGVANLPSITEHPDFLVEANMYDVPRFFESRQWPITNTFGDHYLNSFFIKKVKDKETILDSGKQMRTITTYDYFDADHNLNATSPGFEAMGIDINSSLTFEPSYRLYKQRTTYSAMPNAYSEEEYFYLYDLINHPDHQTAGGFLEDVKDTWKIRGFPFETRTTTKSSADTSVSHAQYTIYSKDWNGGLNGKLYPEKVFQKVETDFGNILEFDPSTFDPTFPYEVLELTTVNDRNANGQTLLETNVKGLQTETVFNPIGLPESTTTGLGLNGAQKTRITYNTDNTINQVIDPNGTVLQYTYDPFLRLHETKRNGELLQDVSYNYWDNDPTKTFEDRTDDNFIETNNYLSDTKKWYERAFVDPIGRPAALVKEGVVLENNLYDTWDRPVLKMKPELGTSPVHGLSYNNFLHLNIQYDAAPRNRPLKSAKYGELLNGHTVNTAYSIISHTDLIAELTPSGQTVLPEGTLFYKTSTTDEDGKTVITYANQLGQTAATLANNGEVSTVFRYDSQGNVMEVVNPLNQINNYDYNYLGQLYRSTTVDDGITLFGYNSSGELVAQQFANGQVRLYQYDIFNRPIHQVSTQTPGILLDNNGLAWVGNNQFESTLNNLINSNTSTFEKKYFYNTYAISGTYPGNALPYLQYSQTNTLGRLAQTTSYDLDGIVTENRWYSYDDDGFLKWEMIQFKLPGTSDKGRLVRIDYKDYNRQGSYETQNVDLNGDGTLDFQYRYKYDNWNRLKEVYTNYDSPDLNNGYKVVSYDYDDVIGAVKKKTYFDSTVDNNTGNDTQQCENIAVDEVKYFYDQRFRLTDITSHLFDWKLYYDNNMDAQHSFNFAANFNGNINTSRGIYKQENTNNILIEQMTGPTIYNYQYDNLNRLVNADAKVIQSGDTPSTVPCGDASYTYDKAGNFLELVRCNNPYIFPYPNYIYTYDYTPGTNRLNTVTTEMGTVHNYTYDGSGNMLTDTKRGITETTYGRAHLPWKIEKQQDGNTQYINYLYDTNDQRIFKALSSSSGSSLSREYYVRTSGGQELAIYNINNNTLTWNVYGNERVAKIKHQPNLVFTAAASDDSPFTCGNGPVPICTEEESGAQNQSLQVLANNWITDPNVLNLPTNLYRIRLCSGAELYILDQELMYLTGSYLTLQTIAINSVDDLFILSSPPGGSLPGEVIADLEEMLTARLTYEGIWINGYNPCDPFDGDLVELESPPIPNLFFYLYDHLGNTRVVYSTMFDCGGDITYSSQSMIDYFPYGKIFREKTTVAEKYLTTQHERDVETGLDYRGARFYDSDIGRFLSLDPLAAEFPAWSPYNYVLGNPMRFIDKDGRNPGDVVVIFGGGQPNPYTTPETGLIGRVVDEINFNDFSINGGSARAFASPIWRTEQRTIGNFEEYGVEVTFEKTVRNGLSNSDLNQLTDEAYNYVVENYNIDNGEGVEGGKIVIAGFSYGGVLANHLATRLGEAGYNIEELITLDPAYGAFGSDDVNRVIHENVKTNLNVYQTSSLPWADNVIGSYGAPNRRADGSTRGIFNIRTGVGHQDIDNVFEEAVYDSILNALNNR